MGDPQGTPGDEPLLFCLVTSKTHQDTSCLLHIPREKCYTLQHQRFKFQHSCWYLPPNPSHPFVCMPARTLAAARVWLACSNPLCRNSTRHSYRPFTLASLHSHVNWHTHCLLGVFVHLSRGSSPSRAQALTA